MTEAQTAPRSLRRTVLFLLLTFGLSWPLAFILLDGLKLSLVSSGGMALAVVYMFMPALAAVLVHRVIDRRPWSELGLQWRWNVWFGVAWLLPVGLALATLAVGACLPGVRFSWGMEDLTTRMQGLVPPEALAQMQAQTQRLPVHPFWLALAQALIAGPTVNAVAALGEELGWRGFLQRELGFLGFWRFSLIIGLVWGVWHLPFILHGHNYPQHPQLGVFFMIYFTVLMAPILSYVRWRARSVIAAAVLHGTLNAVAGISFMVLAGGSDLATGLTGLAGLTVLAAANLGLWVYDRFVSRDPLMRCAFIA